MFRKLIFFVAAIFPALVLPLHARTVVPQPVSTPSVEDDLLPRTVFGVLLGEMALDRGQPAVALGAYVELARRSNDPRVLQRAFQIAAESRQYELALELARRWVRSAPASFPAQQALTAALVQLDRLDELATHLPRMLEQDKERLPEHLLYLNRMLSRQQDRAAVSRLVQKVASPYAGIAEAHYAIALAAYSAKEYDPARSEAAKALELRPDWEMAALIYARILARGGNPAAISFLEDFVGNHAKAADARLLLARLLLAEKEYARSREQFDIILQEHPDSPEVLYPAAMLALRQDEYVLARGLLDRLLRSNFSDKSSVHYYLAMLDEEAKKYEEALAHFEKVIAGEYYLAARGRSAQIMVRQGRPEQALALIRQTVAKTAEERGRLRLIEASLLREIKRDEEALALLDKMLKEAPDDPEILYESALTAERLGKFELFEAQLRRILVNKPEDAQTLNALGYSLADRNIRLDEAYVLIRKAFDLKPRDPFIMDSLGWVYFRQGKVEEALRHLQEAYKIRTDPEIAAHIGEVLWVSGRKEEALAIWREAADKHPQHEELIRTMKRFQP